MEVVEYVLAQAVALKYFHIVEVIVFFGLLYPTAPLIFNKEKKLLQESKNTNGEIYCNGKLVQKD